jgi:hypothetical protein
MSARRTLALLLVCLSVPALVSCSDDGDGGANAAATTAPTAPTDSTDGGSASTDVPTTLEQLPFAEGIEKMNDNLDAASGDVCALVQSLGTLNVADPTTPEEGQQAVAIVVKYLDTIADAAPDEASALHQAADDFEAEAKSASYDVEALSESQVMSSAEVGTALSKATEKCVAPG